MNTQISPESTVTGAFNTFRFNIGDIVRHVAGDFNILRGPVAQGLLAGVVSQRILLEDEGGYGRAYSVSTTEGVMTVNEVELQLCRRAAEVPNA